MSWIEDAIKEQETYNEIMAFNDYLQYVEEFPERELRPCSKYLKDMFDYFDRSENNSFKLFHRSDPTSAPVFGQTGPQSAIYNNLGHFIEEGFNNKFILLVGPNGSSKSSIIRKIMEGAEEYSKHTQGKLFTFSWIFPIDGLIKGQLGLGQAQSSGHLESYAHLDEKDVASILTSDLKDHPLLLLPKASRQKFIDRVLENKPDLLEIVKKSYLYHGDISKRNRMIFDALAKGHHEDYMKVLKHIRVERFIISKRYSSSAVTIEPQLHVDARMQQITMDKRLASLPPGLQSLNLFNMQGEAIMANRGILEFSDLLKRPLDAFKYLLMTMETKTINLNGILTELDIFFIGSSNEIHLAAFKQHPDFNSFKGRINFVRVPFLLNYKDEIKIYEEQLSNLNYKIVFEPGALETLCLWSVMTRLRPCQAKNYRDKRLAQIATSLTPLEKTLLISEHIVPDRLLNEEQRYLKAHIEEVQNEFNNETLYEGKFGISPRELKQIIYEISSQYQNVTFLEIIEYLKKFIERKNEFDFLNIAQQGEYNNPAKFLEVLRDYKLAKFDNKLRESLGLIDARSYEEYIARYIVSINSLNKGEKMRNPITGQFEEVDMYFIKEFENNVKIKEAPEKYRSYMLSTVGAYSLDHPDQQIIYTKVFADTVKKLKDSFVEEQKKVIKNVAKNLIFYISETEKGEGKKTSLSDEDREQINKIVDNLQQKFHYTQKGALTLIKYLINKAY